MKSVATKYSIDQTTKDNGGVLTGVTKGQQEKALDAAIFRPPRASSSGPVKTQFGYYVFEVTKVTPSKQQPLSTSKASIKQILVSQKQQTKLDAFVKDFQKKWKDGRTARRATDDRLLERAEDDAVGRGPGHDGHAAAERAAGRRHDDHPEEVGRVACGGCLLTPPQTSPRRSRRSTS